MKYNHIEVTSEVERSREDKSNGTLNNGDSKDSQ